MMIKCKRCGRRFWASDEDVLADEVFNICNECWKAIPHDVKPPIFRLNLKQMLVAVACMLFWYLLYKWITGG